MKTFKHLNNTVPLYYVVLAALVGLAMVTPLLSSAAPKENNGSSTKGKAYGHLVAPPFFSQFEDLIGNYDWLPPGIQKLIDRRDDNNPPNEDDEPELTDTDTDTATSSADLTFMFDEDVQASLFVSTSSGFDTDDAGVTEINHVNFDDQHEFTLDNLEEDTTYYFRVEFTDEDDNEVLSNQMSFITDDDNNTDETAPSIVEVTADASTSTVDIDVEFNEAAQARLLVSTTTGFEAGDAGVITVNHINYNLNHSFMVDDLDEDTQYYYRIDYRDAANNSALSNQMTFTTDEIVPSDTTGPVISNVVGNSGTTTITGSWTTDEPATSAIYTSTSSGFALNDAGVIKTENLTLKTNHQLTINGLATSTTYYHRVVVEDEAGNETISEQYQLGTN